MTFPDEQIYATILIFSIFISFPLKYLKKPQSRKAVTSAIGFLLVLFSCGYQLFHTFTCFIVNALIIKCFSRNLRLLSFLWCFGYLFFFRVCHLYGFDKPSNISNALQLIFTLKVVSVSIDISDFRDKKNSPKDQLVIRIDNEPDILDLFMYSYCYIGLFTGPFYTYQTFNDFAKMPKNFVNKLPIISPIKKPFITFIIFTPLFFVTNKYFNVEEVRNGNFFEYSFTYKLFFTAMLFMAMRFKFYSAWKASECAFITLGFGVYPENCHPKPGCGPTTNYNMIYNTKPDMRISCETINNVDCFDCEKPRNMRKAMKSWNKSVQWWLKYYIFLRVPIKSFRLISVMMVSSYWHGIHSGYYLALMTSALYILCEDILIRKLTPSLDKYVVPILDLFISINTVRCFEYKCLAFLLLDVSTIIKVWSSLYWYQHIFSLFVVCMYYIIKPLYASKYHISEKKNK